MMQRLIIAALVAALGLLPAACSDNAADGQHGTAASATSSADTQKTIDRSLEDIAAAESAASIPIEEDAGPEDVDTGQPEDADA